MGTCPRDATQPTLEMPQVLQYLTELVQIAMHEARQPSRGGFSQLDAVQRAVRILVDVVECIEHRDLAQAQRQLERSLARTQAAREPWE